MPFCRCAPHPDRRLWPRSCDGIRQTGPPLQGPCTGERRMAIKRREFLGTASAGLASLAMPRLAQGTTGRPRLAAGFGIGRQQRRSAHARRQSRLLRGRLELLRPAGVADDRKGRERRRPCQCQEAGAGTRRGMERRRPFDHVQVAKERDLSRWRAGHRKRRQMVARTRDRGRRQSEIPAQHRLAHRSEASSSPSTIIPFASTTTASIARCCRTSPFPFPTSSIPN